MNRPIVEGTYGRNPVDVSFVAGLHRDIGLLGIGIATDSHDLVDSVVVAVSFRFARWIGGVSAGKIDAPLFSIGLGHGDVCRHLELRLVDLVRPVHRKRHFLRPPSTAV